MDKTIEDVEKKKRIEARLRRARAARARVQAQNPDITEEAAEGIAMEIRDAALESILKKMAEEELITQHARSA